MASLFVYFLFIYLFSLDVKEYSDDDTCDMACIIEWIPYFPVCVYCVCVCATFQVVIPLPVVYTTTTVEPASNDRIMTGGNDDERGWV